MTPDVVIDTYRGFEIMRVASPLMDGPVLFWARATWDHEITRYAWTAHQLRRMIMLYWEAR